MGSIAVPELVIISVVLALLFSQVEAIRERTQYNQREEQPEFYRDSGRGYGLVDKAKANEHLDAKPQRVETPAIRPEEHNTGNYRNPESNPTHSKTRAYEDEMPQEYANRYPARESYRTGYPAYRVGESYGANNRGAEMRARQGMSDTRYVANGEFYYDVQGANHGNAYAWNQIKPRRYFADDWDDEELP